MDLRIQKTLREIRAAFAELSRARPIEKITVKELCAKALINKATFYFHYKNIGELIEEIEDEFVEKLTGGIDYADLFFTDPEQFILRLWRAFREMPDARLLMNGRRGFDLLGILYESLRRSIYKERPEIKSIDGMDVGLTYMLSGLFAVAPKHRALPVEERAKQAGRATAAVLREYGLRGGKRETADGCGEFGGKPAKA
ncbi:MAG: TetR/AcrR family transcriptional regulator [Clostridiales bacterium]|jgi:AcrR family transcriptional regulator|nr:TetR/AcrR family transcriptional regulator [Clostridiales bacterium]